MESELLSCPFCGVVPEAKWSNLCDHHVSCNNGGCPTNPETNCLPTRELAIAAWNTRPALAGPEPLELPMREGTKTPQEFVLRKFPDASCFQTNTSWPGQPDRIGVWLVTKNPCLSMSYASGDTEEQAWFNAAHRLLVDSYDVSLRELAATRAALDEARK